MPLNAIDYSKTIMYKLVCNDLNVKYTYVGHTTSFKDRKRNHKSNCYNEKCKSYNLKIYKIIRENGGWENWSMIEIEKYPCNDLNEATKRERVWYEELNADMNSHNPNITYKEYREYNKEWKKNNKEKIKEQQKKYYEIIKDKLLEKITCECGSIIRKGEISRHNKAIKHQKFIENQQDLISQENYV